MLSIRTQGYNETCHIMDALKEINGFMHKGEMTNAYIKATKVNSLCSKDERVFFIFVIDVEAKSYEILPMKKTDTALLHYNTFCALLGIPTVKQLPRLPETTKVQVSMIGTNVDSVIHSINVEPDKTSALYLDIGALVSKYHIEN